MPFKAEDGTGLADANSQVSLEAANEYFALRNNMRWQSLSDEAKQGALVVGTDFLIENFARLFSGVTLNTVQNMPFPRLLVGIPAPIVKAVCELAFEAATRTGGLWNNPDPTESRLVEKTTGPLTKRYAETAINSLPTTQPRYERIRAILAPLLATDPEAFVLRTRRV
jgi:hypothetical protein